MRQGPGVGPSAAKWDHIRYIAVDGPGGLNFTGDHLRRDRPFPVRPKCAVGGISGSLADHCIFL